MAERYNSINILYDKEKGRRYLQNVIYPDVPLDENDLYVIAVEGDRFDTLAQHFYYDSSKWWIIAAANSGITECSLVLEPGKQIRIPANPLQYIQEYRDLNS